MGQKSHLVCGCLYDTPDRTWEGQDRSPQVPPHPCLWDMSRLLTSLSGPTVLHALLRTGFPLLLPLSAHEL